MSKIIAYKGFNADWTCRGFQFEVGKTYTHDGDVDLCRAGFHACEYPLDVLAYYPPTGKLAVVELEDAAPAEVDGDSKRAARSITIKAALSIAEFVSASIEYATKRCEPVKTKRATGDSSAASATGYNSAASATGDNSAASATGDNSAASATGDRSAASATGYRSAASATGYNSAASATGYNSAASATGDRSAASATGDSSAASATGYNSAASATGDNSAASATGDRSAASATGDNSAASATGDSSAASATGYNSAASATGYAAVAAAFGYYSTAQADKTGAVVVAWWDGQRKRLTVGYVGEDGIEANTPYRCDEAGKLVRA
jgi:hypothetical protein